MIDQNSDRAFLRLVLGFTGGLLALVAVMAMVASGQQAHPAALSVPAWVGASVPGGQIILSTSPGGCQLPIPSAPGLRAGVWMDGADRLLRMHVCAKDFDDEVFVIREDGHEWFVPARSFQPVRLI